LLDAGYTPTCSSTVAATISRSGCSTSAACTAAGAGSCQVLSCSGSTITFATFSDSACTNLRPGQPMSVSTGCSATIPIAIGYNGVVQATCPAPPPAPAPTVPPNRPYVVVTTYSTSNCQGQASSANIYIIGACTAVVGSGGSTGYGLASVSGTTATLTGYANAQCTTPLSPEKVSTGVIGVCSPDTTVSVKVTAPTPVQTPTVPYVLVTNYATSNCQGNFYNAMNLIIGKCTAVPGSSDFYGIVSVTGSSVTFTGYENAQCTTPAANKMSTGVIGVCSTVNSGSSTRVTAPTPDPIPTVPHVVVTNYLASNCQGTVSVARTFIIGACTAVPGSEGAYGIVSVSGSVHHDD
jgi:hypothetical protein